ncbi:GNAT family N-acetyltransferase [Novipirellula artificiosorum]|uniref:Putative acetyltransferase n=1 Tax=Novipirellula artificiosorum TaxID=2528016 RepID=A0A5C6DYQ4_9BACT|nr:GNAT family N-acetyltransferase [Novipirellula artificiosorum]TWU40967.1 putative acetyltransferase [Novipirellula artificiosorum]
MHVQLVEVLPVDYNEASQTEALLRLLHEYASDAAIGSPGLPRFAASNLIDEMSDRQGVNAMIAYATTTDPDDKTSFLRQAAGAVVCIESFSTFAACGVINIHDIMVSKPFRGCGIGKQLLAAVERLAMDRRCAKITLEVFENNHVARRVYERCGFAAPIAPQELGNTLFLAKPLDAKPLDAKQL